MKLFSFLWFFTLICVNFQFQSIEERKAFKDFKRKFGVKYNSKEAENECLKNFIVNYNYVLRHNKHSNQSFQLGLWNEADQLLSATNSKLNNNIELPVAPRALSTPATVVPRATIESLNYVTKGFVNPIQNQLKCGSCWAFASCGALEGQIFKKTGKLVKLSEQQLVDCVRGWWWRSNGCVNGVVDEAFNYIRSYGVTTKENYPYKADDIFPCTYNPLTSVTKLREHYWPQGISEEGLKNLLVSHGPIVVIMNAKLRSFIYYKSGVYNDASCDGSKLSHFVLLVGFGTDPQQGEYWLLRNSYGINWGESGYFRMEMGKNRCGILSYVAYAVL